MFNRKYTPWEHCPKYLSFEEIRTPLETLKNFYHAASIDAHKRRLKKWRDAAVDNKIYKDRFGPGDLVFTHQQVVKLIEASFLLLLEYRSKSWNYKNVEENQIEKERESWGYFPESLSFKMQQNPYAGLKSIFKKIKLQSYRDYLQEWLEYGLSRMPISESMLPYEVITVYESIGRLYDVTWLIFKRNEDLEKPSKCVALPPVELALEKEVHMKPVFSQFSIAQKFSLDTLKDIIIIKVPTAQLVSCLGVHQNIFYLLILIDQKEKRPEVEISNKIEDLCKPLAEVHTLVLKTGSARQGIEKGDRFWSLFLQEDLMLYSCPELDLPTRMSHPAEEIINKAETAWNRWGQQSMQFLEAAEFHLNNAGPRLALFNLHQAMESMIKALIQSVLDFRMDTHNLKKFLRFSLLITDDLYQEFHSHDSQDRELLELLQISYTKSRYSTDFEPKEEAVRLALEKVQRCHQIAKVVFQKFLEEHK